MSVRQASWLKGVLLLLCACTAFAEEPEIYVVVNGVEISRNEVDMAVRMEARRQFYHGRVDETRVEKLRQDVVQRIVDRVLLLAEAEARQLEILPEDLAPRLQDALAQYKLADLAKEQRVSLERELRRQLHEELMIERLKVQVEGVGAAGEAELEAYYRAHLDKFTTPEQLKLSVILLRVQPSASLQVWEAAHREAEQILQRIEQGASFAELATVHSADDSAKRGGDLGYVHQGMLSAEAQAAVDRLQPGQVSPVVTLLQGMALFKLEVRREAVVNPMDEVRDRLEGLWRRDEAQRRWEALLSHLRAGAQIVVNDKKSP